jgi:glycosyltransferase involved in cell wall biosynthesis
MRVERQARFLAGGPPPYVQQLLEERFLDGSQAATPLVRAIAERHLARPFDVVVLEEEAMRWCRTSVEKLPHVVHRLNVFEQVLSDQRRREGPAARTAFILERLAWRRFDRQAMHGAALVVGTTPETIHALGTAGNAATLVVPNGVTMRELRTPVASGLDAAFVGWMGYPPNVDAITWWASDIWPVVRKHVANTELRVIGRGPSAAVRALDRTNGIRVLGEVDDVADACEGIRVGVAPLRAGMGIKNKTLELMSMGVPVVATPRGAEGIGAGSDNGLFVADDPIALATLTTDLLNDPERAQRAGAAARAFVQQHFSWEPIAQKYVDSVLTLTGVSPS